MSDLISRQAAIDAVYKCDDIFAGDMPVMVVKADAYEALAQLPSAQPHITHCAECIHWKHSAVRKSYCDVFDWVNEAEDFCSFAERRTNGRD